MYRTKAKASQRSCEIWVWGVWAEVGDISISFTTAYEVNGK